MEKIKIACCGDSITFGLLASAPECSYPSVMQKLLGEAYTVENFGRSGATAIADYDWQEERRYGPYLKSEEYAASMVSNPDMVILMLGMNDGNPTHCFNVINGGAISEDYLKLYEETLSNMLKGYRNLPSGPKLLLGGTSAMNRVVCNSFSADYIYYFTENLKKIRLVQERLAQRYQIPLIDTLSDMDDPDYYRDGVHLTDKGYAQLAAIMAEAVNRNA